jgi:hypothetical protein
MSFVKETGCWALEAVLDKVRAEPATQSIDAKTVLLIKRYLRVRLKIRETSNRSLRLQEDWFNERLRREFSFAFCGPHD